MKLQYNPRSVSRETAEETHCCSTEVPFVADRSEPNLHLVQCMREERERFKYLGNSLVGTDEVQRKLLQLDCTDVSCTDVGRIRARSVGNEFLLRSHIKYILLCTYFNKTHS